MKTTYKFILAALAATVTLASCTKDPVPGKSDSDSAVTYRTITVSFDSPTKAKLDGTKPKFQDGDTILLSDGTALDTCVVDVDDEGVASITTKLKPGKPLTAVYPMRAVRYTDPGNITDNLLIPTRQSGKFSDANICVARSKDGNTDNLKFDNEYPIVRFYVDSTIAVKSIKIEIAETSTAYIALDTTTGSNDRIITVDAGDLGTLDRVTGERVCYVAVRNRVPALDLTFTSETETQGTVERKSPSAYELWKGYIYNAFIPYSVKVGDQKWGYCNVGAFYPEDPGYYFAWGENKGYKWDAKAGQNGQFQEDRCFDWKNYKYNNNKVEEFTEQEYKEFKEKFCPEGKLALQNDAAQFNWNGNWRMPEKGEFEVLIKENPTLTADETGVVFGDVLKIPYSGKGDNGNLTYWPPFPSGDQLQSSELGYAAVWTKNLTTVALSRAIIFSGQSTKSETTHKISPPTVNVNSSELLYLGLPIRPIYDDSMSGDDEKAAKVTIDNYSDGGIL